MTSTNGSTSGSKNVNNDFETQRIVLTNRNKDVSKKSDSNQKKLDSDSIKEWREDIATIGFAKCINSSCNFISLNISDIQNHYRVCDGVPLYSENLCNNCRNYLPSYGELSQHKRTCKGISKSKQNYQVAHHNKKPQSLDRHRYWEDQIKKSGEAPCGYKDCNFIGMKLSDLEDHIRKCKGVSEAGMFWCISCGFRFQTQEDCERHVLKCTVEGKHEEKDGSMEVTSVKMKSLDEDHIIQPVPESPEGQYRRRRPFTKGHRNSWISTLKRWKYVMCLYENCYFIAMSLEDMISHYGYCNGDGSFARFFCPYCGGRVTSEAVLAKHVERSHPGGYSGRGEGLALDAPKENPSDSQKIPKTKKSDEENTEKEGKEEREMKKAQKVRKKRSRALNADDADDGGGKAKAQKADAPREGGKKKRGTTYGGNGRDNGDRSKDLGMKFPAFAFSPDHNPTLEPVDRLAKEEKPPEGEVESVIMQKKRGKKPKKEPGSGLGSKKFVKCGKCGFEGTKKGFLAHNLKQHVGLGWAEGENPVNMEDEKEVIRLVKTAFKLTKKGICENCQDVKKSFMGFVTHIQSCGKSAEEKYAMKVQCPHCSGKYLKYSLPVHIKISHSGGEEGKREGDQEVLIGGKRLSAIKAVTKFQETLNENEEPEQAHYFRYEKGTEKLPKLCSKLNNLWYRLKREKKKIPCSHGNCTAVSEEVKEARLHHYTCPLLPQKTFMCEACDFYSLEESDIRSHVLGHKRLFKQRKASVEEEGKKRKGEHGDGNGVAEEYGEEEVEDEEDEEEEEGEEGAEPAEKDAQKKGKRKKDDGEGKRKKRKSNADLPTVEVDVEAFQRQNFCRRENLENVRGYQFYNNCLAWTLEEEISDLEASESWPRLHTKLEDWCHVPPEAASLHFPELSESISVKCHSGKWRRMKRFEGDLIDGVPVMFLGGSVRAMSWCKVSFKRMLEKTARQYLAMCTGRNFDHFKDVHRRFPLSESTLLQIWDCGPLENTPSQEAPRLSLGIVHEGGEVWDLSWLPEDASAEGSAERLPRLGLLATASQDGVVRVWSVCRPDHLPSARGLPIYETQPVAKLVTDENLEDSCLRLSVGRAGLIAGGYGNGVLAIWTLKNVSSAFCKTVEKCRVIKSHSAIQAHKTSISAMAFCPGNGRFVSTAGLDRQVKLWDLESPFAPVEQTTRDLCLDVVWTRNWPVLIYSFDDVLPNGTKGFVKFVRDILWEKHQSSFSMESTCLSLSFNDWVNVLAASSNTGDVKIRVMKNFISDQRKTQETLSSAILQSLEEEEAEKPKKTKREEDAKGEKTYEEVVSEFGLVFKDNPGADQKKAKNSALDPEDLPTRAVNKVAFNPNFKSFTHLAAGYNCGLVRIQCLRELQGNGFLRSFLENAGQKC